MNRRHLIAGAVGVTAALRAPRLRAQATRLLRFRPNNDLSIVDPIWSTAFVVRHHGNAVFDTLYGMDNNLNPHPQMVAGHVVEQDGLVWRLTLRDGLKFHDGAPVLARDCVASIRRWGTVDAFGQTLMAATEELTAPSDREIRFRLKKPFPMLPNALGKANTFMPVMMPERLAVTPANRQVTEMVGSGPWKFLAGERVQGARVVYERFADYVPRDGRPEFTSGPKIAHFDRLEWVILPDHATAASALRTGEIDWYDDPILDLIPTLRRDRRVVVDDYNPAGMMGIVRLNHLHPPFNNPAIRRAALGAIDQATIMQAVAGANRDMWTDRVGVFVPESPMANDAGISTRPYDAARSRREMEAAGYRGEKVVFLTAPPSQNINTQAEVASDMMRRAGMDVDLVPLDFGNWQSRRNNRNPPSEGGWSVLTTFLPGLEMWDPAGHLGLRGNGTAAWSGWPTSARLEALRDRWFETSDPAARNAMGPDFQRAALEDVAYIPAGRWKQPTAYRQGIVDVPRHMPLFYTIRREG